MLDAQASWVSGDEIAKPIDVERPIDRHVLDAESDERLKEHTTLLFPTVLMKPRDPSNTQRELRERRDELGYPALSTHSFRKTVATILDQPGLSATEIADYLGHEDPSLTLGTYMNTIRGGTKPAKVLQERLAGVM